MARRFKDMQTPEQQLAARQNQRPEQGPPSAPVGPLTNAEWRQLPTRLKAAHLARLDGDEDRAREWERREQEATTPEPKKRWWSR
ncbi:hypothetical protein ACFV23_30820 [Streptomyces sp. NPDC059627]